MKKWIKTYIEKYVPDKNRVQIIDDTEEVYINLDKIICIKPDTNKGMYRLFMDNMFVFIIDKFTLDEIIAYEYNQ